MIKVIVWCPYIHQALKNLESKYSNLHTPCMPICLNLKSETKKQCICHLLRHSESHMRAEFQHLVHVFWVGWNKRNVQHVLAVLHIMHLTVKLAFVLVLQAFGEIMWECRSDNRE